MTPTLALNAQQIVAARMRGMKPDEMIRVSLVGTLCNGNHVVHAKPGTPHDWRWVRGLDICLYVGMEPTWAETLKDIALERPDYLCIWNAYEHWGARVYLVPTEDDIRRPVRDWTYDLDISEWHEFQNTDFLTGRTYARKPGGMPYAKN